MKEQIKHEPVFGDQSLFECAPFDCIFVVRLQDGNKVYYGEYPKITTEPLFVVQSDYITFAMRRITRAPVWTREDQEAGRMPEVGVTVIAIEYEEECKVAAINNNAVCVVFDDGEFITLHVSGISPIEKPEERAKREREEWVNHAYEKLISADVKGKASLGDIYDAMLSGELKAPGVE